MTMNLRAAERSDLGKIESLLQGLHLPYEDCGDHLANFVVAEEAGELVGIGGLEPYSNIALVRSIAVIPEYRGRGVGDIIYLALKEKAKVLGITELYLLTETADQYFAARGFCMVNRGSVPRVIKHTKQFSELCPASAIVMKYEIR